MKNRSFGQLKISESGVRGIVGHPLTPDMICAFSVAFGLHTGKAKVFVGRDTRPTGEMLEHAVIAGLLSVGCEVVRLGIIPTPTLQYLTKLHNGAGAITISASHNPSEWNALKFIGADGCFLDSNEINELFDIYNQRDFDFADEENYRNAVSVDNGFELHSQKILQNIDLAAIKKRRLKVAVDCCSAVGALYSQKFLEQMNCTVVAIHDDFHTGTFGRDPNPVSDPLDELRKTVLENNCDIGFAQDPDGDRLSLVDNRGNKINEQYSLLLALDHVLAESVSDTVVNIQSSKAVEEIAASYGAKVYYSAVGEINVVDKMREVNALIGGEGNCGGVIYSKIHLCRDSFSSMALMLEMLAQSKMKLHEIIATMPQFKRVDSSITSSQMHSRRIVDAIEHEFSGKNCKIQKIDGIRVDLDDHLWFLARASKTEAVLRLTIEGKTDAEIKKLGKQLQKIIDKI